MQQGPLLSSCIIFRRYTPSRQTSHHADVVIIIHQHTGLFWSSSSAFCPWHDELSTLKTVLSAFTSINGFFDVIVTPQFAAMGAMAAVSTLIDWPFCEIKNGRIFFMARDGITEQKTAANHYRYVEPARPVAHIGFNRSCCPLLSSNATVTTQVVRRVLRSNRTEHLPVFWAPAKGQK